MVDNNTFSIVKSVINKHLDGSKYKAFIFGSRVYPSHRKYSDLDIGILGSDSVPTVTLFQIKEDLSNSDIPFMTDVVDFREVSQNFREKALSHIISL
ncbi:MAG: nucleotidyltransferase domain-containing protein [bacterium]|nr:nucleotidyltransferase domain-containing protein [bacterium]